jgi:hypothetical protein
MADVEVDVWQTFEGPITSAGLAATDNSATYTSSNWFVTDASGHLSADAAAEYTFGGTVNSTADSGTNGLVYSVTGEAGEPGRIEFFFPPGFDEASFGFWMKVPAALEGSFCENDQWRSEGVLATRLLHVKVRGDPNLGLFAFTPEQNYSSGISIEADTWYWCTIKFTRNVSPDGWQVRLYDEDGNQVGSEQTRISSDDPVRFITLGSHIGIDNPGLTGDFPFDDLVCDFTDATYPLGPPIADAPAAGDPDTWGTSWLGIGGRWGETWARETSEPEPPVEGDCDDAWGVSWGGSWGESWCRQRVSTPSGGAGRGGTQGGRRRQFPFLNRYDDPELFREREPEPEPVEAHPVQAEGDPVEARRPIVGPSSLADLGTQQLLRRPPPAVVARPARKPEPVKAAPPPPLPKPLTPEQRLEELEELQILRLLDII